MLIEIKYKRNLIPEKNIFDIELKPFIKNNEITALADEITKLFPKRKFTIKLLKDTCVICFQSKLTEDQQKPLDKLIKEIRQIFNSDNEVEQSTSKYPAYDNDEAAEKDGLQKDSLYQTTGNGESPLNIPGILMVKQ